MTSFSTVIVTIALAAGVLAEQAKEAKAAAALQGAWLVSSINGQSAPDGTPPLTLTFSGDKYQQALGGEVNERGTMKVDATKKPMTIDFAITEGPDAGKTQLGIIEVTGETFRACFAAPGAGERPADFTGKDGALVVLAKKSKP